MKDQVFNQLTRLETVASETLQQIIDLGPALGRDPALQDVVEKIIDLQMAITNAQGDSLMG